MATRVFSRSLPKTRIMASIFSRSFFSTTTTSASALSASSNSSFSLRRRLRPLAAIVATDIQRFSSATSVRELATRATSSSFSHPNPSWSNRPPTEEIVDDGCDLEHWLVVMEEPMGEPVRDEIIDSYIKTLAMVVGSEEEARMKIYSVSTKCYFAFGCLVSEELTNKIRELPGVRWVLPDAYLDVENKNYGGEPFIKGKAAPYNPLIHDRWMRNNDLAKDRNCSPFKPQPPSSNLNGPPPSNNFNVEPNYGGMPQNSMGGMSPPPSNYDGAPSHNYDGAPSQSYGVGGGGSPKN